jgi:hypothetical protein
MKKRLTVSDTSAPEQGNSNTQGDLFSNSSELPRFLGTCNPRHLRVIDALMERPLLREELDRVGGCSNGPELVAELRRLGLDVQCLQETRTDRDGRKCRPGLYILTDTGRRQIEAWRAGQ